MTELRLLCERRSGGSVVRTFDTRDEYERDRARVIHSSALRRLQGKTQVLGVGKTDFHRTRLTHSLEVGQIARGIASFLNRSQDDAAIKAVLPSIDLIEAIGMAHDFGHPPFGHGGEVALNYMMREWGGFEGNAQTLRMLSRLEAHTESFGLDLTRRSMLGILKYPAPHSSLVRLELPQEMPLRKIRESDWLPPKCFFDEESDVVDWLLAPFSDEDRQLFCEHQSPTSTRHGSTRYKTFDATIMEIADDIAYGVHDLEDAVALDLIDGEDWARCIRSSMDIGSPWFSANGLETFSSLHRDLFARDSNIRKQTVGAMVNALIVSTQVTRHNVFSSDLLDCYAHLQDGAHEFLDALKTSVMNLVIQVPVVQSLVYRGQQILMELFDTIASDPERLIKRSFLPAIEAAGGDARKRMRVVCDYISGMTDEYATNLYGRLFLPQHGSAFDVGI